MSALWMDLSALRVWYMKYCQGIYVKRWMMLRERGHQLDNDRQTKVVCVLRDASPFA